MPNARRNSDIPDYCWSCEESWENTDSEPNSYDGEWYCDNCYETERNSGYESDSSENYSGIYSYGYKPARQLFHLDNAISHEHLNPNEPVFGIELETEYIGEGYLTHAVEYIHQNVNPLVYLKEDCSISHGFEIVSHPMTLHYLQFKAERYANMLTYLRTHDYRAWKTSSCGLHIHVSKKSFIDAKHQMKFIYFMFKNKKQMIKFAGRNSGFARYDYDAFVNSNDSAWRGTKPNILECVKGVKKDGNYAPGAYERNLAVNRSNEHTHELRIFRPSLQFNTVLAYTEFAHCLFSYSKQLTSNEILHQNGLTFNPLMEFANANSGLYSNFIQKVEKRNVLKEGDN